MEAIWKGDRVTSNFASMHASRLLSPKSMNWKQTRPIASSAIYIKSFSQQRLRLLVGVSAKRQLALSSASLESRGISHQFPTRFPISHQFPSRLLPIKLFPINSHFSPCLPLPIAGGTKYWRRCWLYRGKKLIFVHLKSVFSGFLCFAHFIEWG